jgi:hypothetical protein
LHAQGRPAALSGGASTATETQQATSVAATAFALAECERKNLSLGVKKFYLELPVSDRSALPNQLIKALFYDHTVDP